MSFRDKILPASEASLRVHGNGFLQAETRCGNKFHVYDTRLPCQKVPTLIHNHNHGFRSTLLIGSLMWREFETYDPTKVGVGDPEALFTPHQCIPRKGKDTLLEATGDNDRALKYVREFILKQGSVYDWPLNMNLYHEVYPQYFSQVLPFNLPPDPELEKRYDYVVSFVERGKYAESQLPTVLVPQGAEPDNEFDRYAFDQIATGIYEQAMENI